MKIIKKEIESMDIKMFIWVMLCYGLTNIVVFGMIFENFREFFNKWGDSTIFFNFIGTFIYKIITCPMCFGLYVGIFFSVTTISPTHVYLGIPIWISWFFDGIFSSGIVWIINSIVEFFEENRINKEK